MADDAPGRWPSSEEISLQVRAGRDRGGLWCCGSTGVLHRWFCLNVDPARRERPPAARRKARE